VHIWSLTDISQHLPKSDKRGWLTRWPPRSLSNPNDKAPVIMYTDQQLSQCVFICSNFR